MESYIFPLIKLAKCHRGPLGSQLILLPVVVMFVPSMPNSKLETEISAGSSCYPKLTLQPIFQIVPCVSEDL